MMMYSIIHEEGKPPLQVDENRGAHFFAMISFFFANQHANTPCWRNMEDVCAQIQFFVQYQEVATSRKLYDIR